MKSRQWKRCMAVTVAAAMLASGVSGCSGNSLYAEYRDVESLEMVRTMGVDSGEDGVTVTVGAGMSLEGAKPRIIKESAETMAAALYMLEQSANRRKPFYSHTTHLVIGEAAAVGGIAGYLDYFERMLEMRMNTGVYLVKGGTAEELLVGTSKGDSYSDEILSFVEEDVTRLTQGYVFTCMDIAVSLARYGCALVMALELEDSDVDGAEEGEKMVKPCGFGILQNGALVGYLTQEEAHGACVLKNLAQEAAATVEDGQGGLATLQIVQMKTTYKPVFEDGVLIRLDAVIQIEANVMELEHTVDIQSEAVRAEFARQLEEQERACAEKAIARAQEMGADFLALEGVVARKKAVQFAKMERSWADIFPELEIAVHVEATVLRTYDVDIPVEVSGEGGRVE